jgi:hypothetical protein
MAEPAMAGEQSPDPGVGMQRAIAQLQQDMQAAREDAARLRDVINVLMQGAAAKLPRPEQNELHEHELEQKKWHEMSEARLRSVEKTVKFPFDLGRKPITVVPGRASGHWWDEVEAGWNVVCVCVKTGSMHCTAFSQRRNDRVSWLLLGPKAWHSTN